MPCSTVTTLPETLHMVGVEVAKMTGLPEPPPVKLRVKDERGHKTCPAACLVPRESERDAAREVGH